MARRADTSDLAYRERARTAPLKTDEGAWKHTFKVVVYWPREGGYGMAVTRDTLDDALAAARSDMALGYGSDPTRHRVRIIETRTRVIEVGLMTDD